MAESLLDALGVVEAFDVVEQRGAELGSGVPDLGGMDPGEFTFECREEGFHCRVVVAVAGGSERLGELEFGDAVENASEV